MIISQKWQPSNCQCSIQVEKDDTIETIPWKTLRAYKKCDRHETVPNVSLAQILIFESKKMANVYEKLEQSHPYLFKSVLIDVEHPELGLEKIPNETTKIITEWLGTGLQRKIKVEIVENEKKIGIPEIDREMFDYIRKVKKII